MPKLLAYLLLAFSIVLLCIFNVSAQNNYSTQTYSAYSTLTGGACMSCSDDNSMFIYNPGALGFMDSVSVNISANLYGIEHIRLKNAVGNGINLRSNKLSVNAQVMSGNVYFKKIPRLHLVYGYIMRNFSRLEFDNGNEMMYDVIPQAPGMEYYRSKFDLGYIFMEYWGGIAAAYQVNKNLSLGLGHYGGYINVRSQWFQDMSTDGMDENNNPFTASTQARFKYNLNHFYILFKPGIDMRFGKWGIGLSAMLPSVTVWSQGLVYQSIKLDNMNIYPADSSNALTQRQSLTVIGDEKNLKTKFKLPASISLGITYGDANFRIMASAEYFFAIKEYNIIEGGKAVYIRPTTAYGNVSIPNFMTVTNAARAVINASVGIDKKLSPKLSLLAGFRTDFNNKVPLLKKDYKDYIVPVNPEYWNYLHYAIGFAINKPSGRTYIGLTYKQGFSNYNKAFANFTEPSNAYLLSGAQRTDMKTSIHGVGISVGYTNFANGKGGLPFNVKKKKPNQPL